MTTKRIAWDSGGGYITLTYIGSGNGDISVVSDVNESASSRSKTITIRTTDGGVVTKNLTVSQAACPFPVGTVKNYSYTGSYQEVTLPAGKYKLQCWGAQGGNNGTNSSYGIIAKTGGKGGYSEGILTLSSVTKVRVYVGGQGGTSSGGFNGGGSTTGTSQLNSGDTFGYSKMGGGGGATDIRLSDGALLSRMIVAGGGSGGAMCYKKVTTTVTESESPDISLDIRNIDVDDARYPTCTIKNNSNFSIASVDVSNYRGWTLTASANTLVQLYFFDTYPVVGNSYTALYKHRTYSLGNDITKTFTVPASAAYLLIFTRLVDIDLRTSVTFSHEVTQTTTSTDSQDGYAGGGTEGAGFGSIYVGKQNGAGINGSFGQGANQSSTNVRYCSGAGGGGWYGGGGGHNSNSEITYVAHHGGGSGWVNVAASAGNRPSGYTGLELDSGTTYAGNTSFPSTGGDTETGHSGNGYARITRLE